MRMHRTTFLLATCLALAACNSRDSGEDGPVEPVVDDTQTPTPVPSATTSILRDDIDLPADTVIPVEPLRVTVDFPEGGAKLDAAAIEALDTLLTSEQMVAGGPIVLRGHSDASGDSAVNRRVSRSRAETVRDWLIGEDVEASRMTIIAFGEQNPIEPNALPDGTPNEEGRAVNRRVEVTIEPPERKQPQADAAAG